MQREFRLAGDVDAALGEQHVGPEVPVRPGPPAASQQVDELLALPGLDPAQRSRSSSARRPRSVATSETRIWRGRHQRLAGVRAAAQTRPPAAAQRGRADHADDDLVVDHQARSGWPRPAPRGRSSWCRRSGRSPSAADPSRCRPSPRRARRRAAGPGRACDGWPPRRRCRRRRPASDRAWTVTCRSSALNRLMVIESASSASRWASRRSSVRPRWSASLGPVLAVSGTGMCLRYWPEPSIRRNDSSRAARVAVGDSGVQRALRRCVIVAAAARAVFGDGAAGRRRRR